MVYLRKIKTIQISSTSPPGGNLVDGLPPASSLKQIKKKLAGSDGGPGQPVEPASYLKTLTLLKEDVQEKAIPRDYLRK